jgi:hypothetical protein
LSGANGVDDKKTFCGNNIFREGKFFDIWRGIFELSWKKFFFGCLRNVWVQNRAPSRRDKKVSISMRKTRSRPYFG